MSGLLTRPAPNDRPDGWDRLSRYRAHRHRFGVVLRRCRSIPAASDWSQVALRVSGTATTHEVRTPSHGLARASDCARPLTNSYPRSRPRDRRRERGRRPRQPQIGQAGSHPLAAKADASAPRRFATRDRRPNRCGCRCCRWHRRGDCVRGRARRSASAPAAPLTAIEQAWCAQQIFVVYDEEKRQGTFATANPNPPNDEYIRACRAAHRANS